MDKLEAKHLVRRVRCPADRRQVLCWITPEGEALLARLDPALDQTVAGVFDRLTPEQLRGLIDSLEQIRAE
jgi:MarR family 2-MHQ and catechol resistance regulon transcriptional repressor